MLLIKFASVALRTALYKFDYYYYYYYYYIYKIIYLAANLD